MGCNGSSSQWEEDENCLRSEEEQRRPYKTFYAGRIVSPDGSFKARNSRSMRRKRDRKQKDGKRVREGEREEERGGERRVTAHGTLACQSEDGELEEWDDNVHEGIVGSDSVRIEAKNVQGEKIPFSIFRAFDRQEKFRRLDRRKEIERKWRQMENSRMTVQATPQLAGFSADLQTPSDLSIKVDSLLLKELVDSGFEEELTKNALRRTRNNKKMAVEYILSRPSCPRIISGNA